MKSNLLKAIYKWTVRVIVPVFVFTQLFIACPAAYAADQNELTVTGTPINVQADTNSLIISANAGASTNNPNLIKLNFEETDIRTILLQLAELTGETILLDKNIRGNVTIINTKPVPAKEAVQIIYSILEMQGFTIVRYDKYVKIVRSGDAKTRPIQTLQSVKEIKK